MRTILMMASVALAAAGMASASAQEGFDACDVFTQAVAQQPSSGCERRA